MSSFIDRQNNTILSSRFTDMVYQVNDLYQLGIKFGSVRSSMGFYTFATEEEVFQFYTWQDALLALKDMGVPFDMNNSFKGIRRFTVKMTEAFPELSSKDVIIEESAQEGSEDEFSIGKNQKEMATDRVAESFEVNVEEDKTEETGSAGAEIVGDDRQSDEGVGELIVRTDFENIPWKTLNGPRYSKSAIIELAKEFGIVLTTEGKKELIDEFESSVGNK